MPLNCLEMLPALVWGQMFHLPLSYQPDRHQVKVQRKKTAASTEPLVCFQLSRDACSFFLLLCICWHGEGRLPALQRSCFPLRIRGRGVWSKCLLLCCWVKAEWLNKVMSSQNCAVGSTINVTTSVLCIRQQMICPVLLSVPSELDHSSRVFVS